jgi:ribosomal protein S19
MSKSKWKVPFTLKKEIKSQESKKIWRRSCVILKSYIRKNFLVHNGKEFKRITILREHVGYKFGEFVTTRTHTKKLNGK